MKEKSKKIAFLGIVTALALVLSFVESLLPPLYSAVPGIKIGLPNIIVIFTLYKLSFKEAAAVSLVRVFAVSLLFGNPMTFAYSITGAVLSLLIMVILKKTNSFSLIAISIAGAVFHNIGQIMIAVIILQTAEIGYYLIPLTVSGVLSGTAVGIVSAIIVKKTTF